jgi:hypothetical protein
MRRMLRKLMLAIGARLTQAEELALIREQFQWFGYDISELTDREILAGATRFAETAIRFGLSQNEAVALAEQMALSIPDLLPSPA